MWQHTMSGCVKFESNCIPQHIFLFKVACLSVSSVHLFLPMFCTSQKKNGLVGPAVSALLEEKKIDRAYDISLALALSIHNKLNKNDINRAYA
jgi:hypothetical protein